ncbi:MAG: Carbamoyltransferase [Candidatus Magnetoglobus multicellularis str. Araruama]|uniref:Carbamoyltransferase n=1 Tax=Candidatus Magnetoglobus multicellularis str. Araruama TaxID=890399 RepID=A0A1V1PEQ9_9BACT|nr:MAG: Carbamoyltransferase [Candidatus Magnetoglobus multicellularis str. Araruama]
MVAANCNRFSPFWQSDCIDQWISGRTIYLHLVLGGRLMSILGISAFYHDSAAVFLSEGKIIAAAQEERFSRKKHDAAFPENAIKYVLDEASIPLNQVSTVAFYEKPYIKFERLMETYHSFAPKGLTSFISAMTAWLNEKLFMRRLLKDKLAQLGLDCDKIKFLFPEHHLSHAASAFFPSPFDTAAILTIDGVGEWATTTICKGSGSDIQILKESHFPHSLGLLYSAFTYYCGFRVNSGEYKLMGLAPYGNHGSKRVAAFENTIVHELVDIRQDGSFLLNMKYFNFATGLTMCKDKKWHALFGIPKRDPETPLSQAYMDMALAIQNVTERIIFQLAQTTQELTQCDNLVMAGGVALNCVANGKLIKSDIFKDIWIQPAAGDAGGALGAALASWYIGNNQSRFQDTGKDMMAGAYLGPQFHARDIEKTTKRYSAKYRHYSDFSLLARDTAALLADGNVIGWFQGRMEYGPRALGNRSILGDPRNPEMQKKLNLKIKYREGFRPFAPSVLEEDMTSYFELKTPSPYMLLVANVMENRKKPLPEGYDNMEMYDRLYHIRSDIPAITHVDYSARIQSVSKETNARYWQLIDAFKTITGFGILVNTSFNVRGEPIVCTPTDAYRCFMRTEMDFLVMDNYLFDKTLQPEWADISDWETEYVLD